MLRPSYGVFFKDQSAQEQDLICFEKLGRQEAELKSRSEEVDPKLLLRRNVGLIRRKCRKHWQGRATEKHTVSVCRVSTKSSLDAHAAGLKFNSDKVDPKLL